MANARFAHEATQSDKRFAFQRSEGMLDRRHARESQNLNNDLTLQMKIMETELADKRLAYDRETRDMNRRQQLIAQLMSGLGSLGGAFAL